MSATAFPIRPLSLSAENFRGLGGEHSLDLGRALLVGKDGAGKSSLLVAVESCLSGAQATKKTGSGIAERGDWALAHEGATGDVRVTLELEVEGGRARLTRRRALGARARDEDDVQLELPGDEVLSGHEVEEWLSWNHMPDWSTWKRSFCQHQEQSRARVTESADRSTAIAGMLGLEEFRVVNDELKQLKVKRLEKRATDVEALGALARGLEDEQSEEQIAAVNESIDTYFSTITGDSGRGRVRVQSKKTATKVAYQLVDPQGRSITSRLNQAAFNALSLAMLFASADSRARRGRPQFLVLDDPDQSLDEDHQAGLARAITKFAPVLVGTVPGALADALRESAAETSRTYLHARTGDGASTIIRKA